MRAWWRFLISERGNMGVLFAGGMAVSAVISAFAVDAASLYNERRMLQRHVDLAAIAAAGDPANGLAIAYGMLSEASAVAPGLSLAQVTGADAQTRLLVEPGHYRPDTSLAAEERFEPDATPFNAVRVRLSHPGTLYFARSWSPMPIVSASAVASANPQVAFSVGSRLASLKGGFANVLLNTLLGTDIALTVADYNGLVGAKVDAFAFLDALALELGIAVGTYDDVLAASADHGQIARALAAVLNGTQRTIANTIARAAGNNGAVDIAKLIGLGELGQVALGSGGRNLFTDLSALDLLAASASLADGANQVALNLTAGVPNLASIETSLAVGEPPQGGRWFAVGPPQTVTRTAQLRLRLVAKLLGGLLLGNAAVHLPIYLDIAHAEAVVANASCATGSATIHVRPGAVRLVLGEIVPESMADFNASPVISPARIVAALGIIASAHIEIAQTHAIALEFSARDIAEERVKTARTTTVVSSLVGSLLKDLKLNIGGLNLDLVTQILAALLTPVAPTLDLTIATLLETLGISLGEADVRVYGVRCGTPVLVG